MRIKLEMLNGESIVLEFATIFADLIYGNQPNLGLDQPQTVIELEDVRSIEYLD